MSFTLCTSGAIIAKAGANVNTAAAASSALIANWSDQTEGMIVTITRRDWVTDYTVGVQAEVKLALADVCSDLAAMKLIAYDTSNYSNRREAELMLDVLENNSKKILEALKDFKSNDIKGVT